MAVGWLVESSRGYVMPISIRFDRIAVNYHRLQTVFHCRSYEDRYSSGLFCSSSFSFRSRSWIRWLSFVLLWISIHHNHSARPLSPHFIGSTGVAEMVMVDGRCWLWVGCLRGNCFEIPLHLSCRGWLLPEVLAGTAKGISNWWITSTQK